MSAIDSSARDRAIEAVENALDIPAHAQASLGFFAIQRCARLAVDELLDHPEVLRDLLAEVDAREAAETVRDAWRGR